MPLFLSVGKNNSDQLQIYLVWIFPPTEHPRSELVRFHRDIFRINRTLITCAYSKLESDTLMTDPAEDWNRFDAANLLDPAKIRSVFLQRDMGADLIVIRSVSLQDNAGALRRTRRGGREIRDVSIRCAARHGRSATASAVR